MIVHCSGVRCLSDYQDTKYGLGKRVANQTKDPEKARCTVCNGEVRVSKSDSAPPPVKTKKK